MEQDSIGIGETVYFFSSKLNEVCIGKIEGYYTDDYKVLKILQTVSDGKIRHVIPYTSVSKDKETVEIIASTYRREKVNESLSSNLYSGCVVLLKNPSGELVCDDEGNPYKYQVIAVYSKQARAKLVTDYGEEIGMYSVEDIVVTDEDPLFTMEDYTIGERIVWAEYDEVYSGVIKKLHSSSAEIGEIHKLYPLDVVKKVPYYKIPKNGKSGEIIRDILITISDVAVPSKGEG